MAKKKGVGSSKNGRDSKSKRLGVKIYGNQPCTAGAIIIRQKGNKYRAGESVGTGKDFTLFALKEGVVSYREKRVKKFNGRTYKITFVEVN